jgi:hypothetical protein
MIYNFDSIYLVFGYPLTVILLLLLLSAVIVRSIAVFLFQVKIYDNFVLGVLLKPSADLNSVIFCASPPHLNTFALAIYIPLIFLNFSSSVI